MAAFAQEGEEQNPQGQNPQHDDPANQGQNGGQHKQNDQHKSNKHDRKHKDRQNINIKPDHRGVSVSLSAETPCRYFYMENDK